MVLRLLTIAMLMSFAAAGQSLDSLEISREAADTAQTDSIYPKPKAGFISNFLFQFDNRNERYYDTRARMNGIKIGFEYYKRLRLGFGIYGNNNFYPMNFPDAHESLRFAAKMNYQTLFAEYVFYKSFRWELSASIARGTGRIQLNTFDNQSSIPELIQQDTISRVRLYDFGFNAQFKIFPWFALGAGVGYRTLNLPKYPELQGPFSDPYFDFKLKLFLGYFMKSIFNRDIIEAERLYYQQRSKRRRTWFREHILEL